MVTELKTEPWTRFASRKDGGGASQAEGMAQCQERAWGLGKQKKSLPFFMMHLLRARRCPSDLAPLIPHSLYSFLEHLGPRHGERD